MCVTGTPVVDSGLVPLSGLVGAISSSGSLPAAFAETAAAAKRAAAYQALHLRIVIWMC